MYLMEIGKLPRLTPEEQQAAIAAVVRTRTRFRLDALENEFVLCSAVERLRAMCDGREPFYQALECSVMIPSSERKRIASDISRRLSAVDAAMEAGEDDYRIATTADLPAPQRRAAWRRLVRLRSEAARLVEQSALRTECLLGPLHRLGEALSATGKTPATLDRRLRKTLASYKAFDAAKHVLLNGNLRLVVAVAKHYRDRGLSLPDLVQEGNLGLMRAVEKVGYPGDYGFSSYATSWIQLAIRRALGEQGGLIRLPPHVVRAIARLRGATGELSQDLRRSPNLEQVAGAAGISPARLADLIQLQRRPLRLTCVAEEDAVADDEIDIRMIEDFRWDATLREVSQRYLPQYLDGALAALGDRERKMLRLRFGLADGRRRTLREVGVSQSLTNERIRQIEKDSLRRLRSSPAGKRLEDLL
jgi:RNA polymerase primary sigma factor